MIGYYILAITYPFQSFNFYKEYTFSLEIHNFFFNIGIRNNIRHLVLDYPYNNDLDNISRRLQFVNHTFKQNIINIIK